ncbi:MAG TPA: hypothetical protein VG015_07875 [Candidatus Dormibacteraeota bacterium]|jgi:uncharacterized Ntn-hydrolase superfamily protein|nr:hypothetical protein [Candidatus Dormibacteraeota bacterium]
MSVNVTSPKGPIRVTTQELPSWARTQLGTAASILGNPGGGLLFATQTIGQVRSALADSKLDRFEPALALLAAAEDASIRRDYAQATALIADTIKQIK